MPIMSARAVSTVERVLEPRNLAIILVIISALVAGGLAFVLAHRPPPMAGTRLVWPSINMETSAEMLVVGLLYLLGFAGLWMVYEAEKHRHRGEYVNQYVMGGIVLFLLSLIMLFVMSAMK